LKKITDFEENPKHMLNSINFNTNAFNTNMGSLENLGGMGGFINKQLEEKIHELSLEIIKVSNKMNKYKHEAKDFKSKNIILEHEVADLQNANFEKKLLHDNSKDDVQGLNQKIVKLESKEKLTCTSLDKLMNKYYGQLLDFASQVDDIRVPGCDLKKNKPRVSMEIHNVQTKDLDI